MRRRFGISAFRRTSALLLMVTLASLLLVACGSSTATNTPGTSATTAAAPAATTAAAPAGTTAAAPAATTAAATGTTAAAGTSPAAPGGGASGTTESLKLNPNVSGNIDFWHIWASPIRRNAIRRVIAVCNQLLPNIKVKETYKPFGDIWTANTAAVAAGSGMPDVIVEDRPKLPQAAANNVEQSLQKYATRDGVDGSIYWPFTWQETLYNKETYGLPFETDVRILYWNKNLFKEAGLDPEKPPKTWAEVEQYADKLDKKQGESYTRYGFMPLIRGGWDLYSYTDGAELVAKDGTKVNITDPKVAETINWIKKWVDRYGGWGAYQKFRGTFQSPPNDEFMGEKVAMMVDIGGYASSLNFYRPKHTLADGKTEDLVWGVGDVPSNGTQASTSGGFALSIPKGAKNADAAWEFIKCAAGPQGQSSWARDTYAMPSVKSAAQDPVLLADPSWQFMVNAMSYSRGATFVPAYANWSEQIDKRINDVYEGKTDAKTMLDQAQQAIDAEIAKNKK